MSHTETDYADRIRENGYRLTPQRQIILDTLCSIGGHVPVITLVESVQEIAPAIDRATVYRSVNFFVGLGLVVSSDVDGMTVVEIAPAGEPRHSHLVCEQCGHIEHVPANLFGALANSLYSEYGFSADLDNMTIQGTCRECNANSHA